MTEQRPEQLKALQYENQSKIESIQNLTAERQRIKAQTILNKLDQALRTTQNKKVQEELTQLKTQLPQKEAYQKFFETLGVFGTSQSLTASAAIVGFLLGYTPMGRVYKLLKNPSLKSATKQTREPKTNPGALTKYQLTGQQ